MISTQRKSQIIGEYRTGESDTGSSEVQIAILTDRINSLSEHLRSHRKDNHSRRGLMAMVARRNRLLKYLSRTRHDKYSELIGRLGLRK